MPQIIRSRPTPWKTVILLCGKCSRKMKGGYGPKGKETLRSAMRDEFKAQEYQRDTRIVGTRCLGVCPKKSVTTVNASQPGEIFVIPKGCTAIDALARMIDGTPEVGLCRRREWNTQDGAMV